MKKTYTPIDPKPLSKTVTVLVYVQIAATALYVGSAMIAVSLYGRPSTSDWNAPVTTPYEDVTGLPAAAYFLIWVIAGFFSLKWIYRVNRNAHAFARGLSVSPPWAVGWFFVPIAFLFKPYEAMSQAWRASERPEAWRTAKVPSFMPWWWGTFIAGTVVGNVGGWAAMAGGLADATASETATMLSLIIGIPSDLLFLRLVRRLSDLQLSQMTFGADAPHPEPAPMVLEGGA